MHNSGALATTSQLEYLKRHNIAYELTITKYEASNLINGHMSKRKFNWGFKNKKAVNNAV